MDIEGFAEAIIRHNPSGYSRQAVVYNADDVAPAAETVRATRTVPANTRAVIAYMHAALIRDLAATTVGRAFAEIRDDNAMRFIWCSVITNAVGDERHEAVGGNIVEWLTAASAIDVRTSDASAGGEFNFRAGVVLIELTI